jgi:hypothetical protein
VSRQTGESVAGADTFARDWEALRADGDIQFAPVTLPEPATPPQWWLDLLEFLGRSMGPVADAFAAIGRTIGLSGQALMWIVVALAMLVLALLLWRRFASLAARRGPTDAPAPWRPEESEAAALLADADRLAAEGRFDEATRLLLRRSVDQIAAARPGLLEPSSTAREISALPALPETARSAFGTIASQVERSLFALRRLDAEEWRTAREAYARFAIAAPVAA